MFQHWKIATFCPQTPARKYLIIQSNGRLLSTLITYKVLAVWGIVLEGFARGFFFFITSKDINEIYKPEIAVPRSRGYP